MKKRKKRVFPLILGKDDGLEAAVNERYVYLLTEGVADGLGIAVDEGLYWMDVHEVYKSKQEILEVLPDVLLQQVLEEKAETCAEDPALDKPWLSVRLFFEGLYHASDFFRPAKHKVRS